MHERVVGIPTKDGRMETFVTHPEQDGPFPPVVLYIHDKHATERDWERILAMLHRQIPPYAR